MWKIENKEKKKNYPQLVPIITFTMAFIAAVLTRGSWSPK
jgi:hypothetical protein